MKTEDQYFINLLKNGYIPDDINAIKAAIDENGSWQAVEGWRIATDTEFKIYMVEKYDKEWYRVEVKCDYEFMCNCPSLEKAIEMAKLYQAMIENMYHQLGWPSK